MKTIFLLTILLIGTSTGFVCAQDPEVERHSLRLEAGYSFTAACSLTYPVILMGLKPRSLAALLTPPIAAGFGRRDAGED